MKKFTLLVIWTAFSCFAGFAQEDMPARASFRNGKLTFETRDRAFRLWFDHRIYVDAAAYLPSEDVSGLMSKPNKDLEYDDGAFRFSNGMSIRRARFAVKATLYEKWFGELDLDFAYNEVELKDMFIGYRFSDRVSVKVGHFKEPMSMERLTSSKYLINMERPMAVEAFAGGGSGLRPPHGGTIGGCREASSVGRWTSSRRRRTVAATVTALRRGWLFRRWPTGT